MFHPDDILTKDDANDTLEWVNTSKQVADADDFKSLGIKCSPHQVQAESSSLPKKIIL